MLADFLFCAQVVQADEAVANQAAQEAQAIKVSSFCYRNRIKRRLQNFFSVDLKIGNKKSGEILFHGVRKCQPLITRRIKG